MIRFNWLLTIQIFYCAICSAQQKAHYSQYAQNLSVLNPAVTGTLQGLDFRLGLRSQWQGLTDAPKTGYITFGAPISFGSDMSNYRASDLGVVEPENLDESVDYLSAASHHAIGAVFLSDKTGALNRITANLTYAYHLALGDKANLSTGIGIGVNRLGLKVEDLVFDELNDPVVGNSNTINKYTPDLNAGLYFYTSNFYIAASMQQILRNKIKFDGTYTIGKDVIHYFIIGGYNFWINQVFMATPSVMVKSVNPLPVAYDLSLKLAYQNQLWVSTGYRKNDAYFASFGFNIQSFLALNYGYDFTTSRLRTASTGSHELTVRMLLK